MPKYITDIFAQSGPIAGAMPGYEVRPQQIDMARAIEASIERSEQLIVEAGTGVGKSFSYLVPIAEYAREARALAIVSTNTISLQEQIIHKDIPFLEKALGKDFKAVLVKGKKNYLCLRRLHKSNFKQKDLFSDEYEMRHFAKIFAWSYKTQDGSLYDIAEEPDPKVWDMVSVDPEACSGKKCTYYKSCFLQKAREKMHEAHILIVNHHLFFSNLAIEEDKRMLPEYDILVFDEAHSMEGVATNHLGTSVSNRSIKYLMDLLFNPKKEKGFLLSVGDQESMEWVEVVRKRTDHFFKEVQKYLKERRLKKDSDSVRIRGSNFVENDLSAPISKLMQSLTDARKHARTKEDELDITSFIRKVTSLNNSLDAILNQTLNDYVYWVDYSKNKTTSNISINAAPINIGNILSDVLFSSPKPIILTSATLTINNSFKYLKDRIGLKDTKELVLGSPFDYKNQVRIYIARGMPNPDDLIEYAHASSERIKRYIGLTNGSAFVLFTSYSLMNIVYEELEAWLCEKGFNALKQGSGIGRTKMLKNFKEEAGSVLFGVDSFWQGVDVQGKALSNVIITKLPFSVPDHPIIQARIEEIEKRGGDAFLEYNLPEAVLRFKQGFGRLVRSKRDTGIIAILDSRIINKSYGRSFLNSIPKCEIVVEK